MSQHSSSSTSDPFYDPRNASAMNRELDDFLQSSPALSITPDRLNTAFTNVNNLRKTLNRRVIDDFFYF